jgi:hypothetical protein
MEVAEYSDISMNMEILPGVAGQGTLCYSSDRHSIFAAGDAFSRI